MEEVNGSSTKNKPILFSIGSYKEDKKQIKKIGKTELFSTPNSIPPSPTTTVPTRNLIGTFPRIRPVSLDITDSSRLRPTLHRPPINTRNGLVEKPICPPSQDVRQRPTSANPLDLKPAHPPQLSSSNRSNSLEPEQLRHSGRVALTIAAYEGEPRTPTRMDFLPSTRRLSRSSSRTSDASTPDGPEPITARLHSELADTLKRSNLRKRNDGTAVNGVKAEEERKVENKEETEIANGSVKRLANVLDKTLTFKQ